MMEFTDLGGRTVRVHIDKVIAIHEPTAVQRWNGTRSIVRIEGVGLVESRDDPQLLIDRFNEEDAKESGHG